MDYYLTIENCSARVRNLPNPTKLYDDAFEKYMKNPMYRPPAGDEQARRTFFASVGEICKTKPSTPEEYVYNLNSWLHELLKPVKVAS